MIRMDYAEAVKWVRKSAEQGNADAQYALGKCYHFGDGVPQDRVESMKWFRMAARQGHSEALRRVNDF